MDSGNISYTVDLTACALITVCMKLASTSQAVPRTMIPSGWVDQVGVQLVYFRL